MRKPDPKRVLKVLLFIAVGLALLSFAVMQLWNFTLPHIVTGVSTISYVQAMAILVLSKILFGRFGRPHHHGHGRGKCGSQQGFKRGRGPFGQHLSPEERAELKAKLRQKMMSPESESNQQE